MISPRLTGLIPAHAGKTPTGRQSTGEPGAHPRSRGENGEALEAAAGEFGSSPLTRGKPSRSGRSPRRSGLIPAHAGKTARGSPGARSSRAHPRSRGENTVTSVRSTLPSGSSPLTLGKLTGVPPIVRVLGLIPAHAGKTCTRFLATFGSRAHPRSRGENLSGGRVWPFGRGSSPLTRGKPSGPFLPLEPRGLIPAHAGKTHCRSPRSAACPAHPRSRGENYCHISRPRGEPGSSPLTRGKRRRAGGRASGSGLIPAHAGKTPRWRPVRPAGRAHPRSRGENADMGRR